MTFSPVASRTFFVLIIFSILLAPIEGRTDELLRKVPLANGMQLVFRPAGLDFGLIPTGKTSAKSLTIVNSGNSVIDVARLESSSREFAISGLDLPVTLSAGQSFTFIVRFTPVAVGATSGHISLLSGNPGLTVPVTGGGSSPVSGDRPLEPGFNSESDSVSKTTGSARFMIIRSVEVRWDASKSRHIAGYNLFRGRKSGGPYHKINHGLISRTAYTDYGVRTGIEYFYVATAVNSKGAQSKYSKQVHVTVP